MRWVKAAGVEEVVLLVVVPRREYRVVVVAN